MLGGSLVHPNPGSHQGQHTGLWRNWGLSRHWRCGQAGQLAARGYFSLHLSPQGLAVLVLFCVLNEEVREAWKLACLGKKGQSEEATRSTQVGKSGSSPGIWGQAACLGQELTGTSLLPRGGWQVQVGRPSPGLLWHFLNRAHALSPCLARAPTPTTTQRCLRRAGSSASPWGPLPSHR